MGLGRFGNHGTMRAGILPIPVLPAQGRLRMSSDLQFLASLLKSRNTVDGKIANIIRRPTHLQDVGSTLPLPFSGLHLTMRPRIKAAVAVLPMDHWPGTALISSGMSGVTEN
jgi:hypothetical protein